MSCPDGVCPGDMECREGRCVYEGASNACSAAVSGAGGGAGSHAMPGKGAGHGGDGDDDPMDGEAGTLTAGGASPGGSCGVSCGDTGTELGPRLTLSIDGLPDHACTGDEVNVAVSVDGGVPPYTWKLTGDVPGVEFRSTRAAATLRGQMLVAGDYSVTVSVTDHEGHHVGRDVLLSVGSTPVVTTTSEDLGTVCQNELYSRALVAEGGDDSDYTWSADVPLDTGLALAGDHLTGRFVAAGDVARNIPLTVRVESGGCESAPVMLNLEANAVSATECPRIRPRDYWPSLPAPCRGLDYSVALLPDDGHWRAKSLPDGIFFDADTATLSGSMSAPGTVTIEVEAASGRVIEGDFTLTPRQSCWLAYVAGDDSARRLELFDPALRQRQTLPRDEHPSPVMDFAFSPNGRWLAYRTGTDTGQRRLTLLDMATLGEAPLEEFAAVTRYQWTEDSTALHVAFDTSEGHYLGGIVPTSAKGKPTYVPLSEGIANVASPLFAFGPSAVAFLTPDPPIERFATANRTPDGLADAQIHNESFYVAGDWLHRAPNGVFGIKASAQDITYWPADGSYGTLHNDILVAPSGRYVGRPQNDALAIFLPTEDSSYAEYPAHAESLGCGYILAWAEQLERVACSRAGTGDDPGTRITFFDIDSDADTVGDMVPLRGGYAYTELSPPTRHRLFSPTGTRFAFTTDTHLYLAGVSASDAVMQFDHEFWLDPAADAELAFSPDEAWILAHRGAHLSLVPVDGLTHDETIMDGDLPPSTACDDRFRAKPGTFCGELRSESAFAWSPTSDLIAYGTNDAQLRVYDLNALTSLHVADDCSGSCRATSGFAFQPQ